MRVANAPSVCAIVAVPLISSADAPAVSSRICLGSIEGWNLRQSKRTFDAQYAVPFPGGMPIVP